MKTLKLDAVLQGLKNNENVLFERAIISFLEGTVREFMTSDKEVDVMDNFPITYEDLIEENSHENVEHIISISENNTVQIKMDISCEHTYNETDESEVGLGGVGALNGYDDLEVEITEITLFTHEGSEFDLSSCTDLLNDIHQLINIE